MRRLAITAAFLLAGSARAQVSETIDVRVVNVDVTVTSKGAPVRGLTAADFDIIEDGRRQTITNFYAAGEAPSTATATPATQPAAADTDPRFRRKVLVLVDNNHTTRHTRDAALRQLETMINDRFHGDSEWSIGAIGRGVTLVLPLTSDKQAIHEAIEMIRRAGTKAEGTNTFAGDVSKRDAVMVSRLPSDKTGWSLFDRDYDDRLAQASASDDAERAIAARFTAPAILAAARGFAGTPGRKVILFLTGDPGLNDIEKVKQVGDGFVVRGVSNGKPFDKSNELWSAEKIIEDLRTSIIHEANASDVSFYVWNVEGLVPADADTQQPITNTSAVFWLSKETGGQLVTGNNAAQAVQAFDTASSSFYSLGYKPSHPDDGKYHTISVSLKRKGDYGLSYRSGYSDSSTATQLKRAMTSPTAAAMQASALPVSLEFGTPETAREEVTLPFAIKVPFRDLQFLPAKSGVAANLMIYVSVFDNIGKNLVATTIPLTPGFKSGAPDPKGTLVYRNAVKLRKGERHRIVVAIRDAVTDSVGMATEVVKF